MSVASADPIVWEDPPVFGNGRTNWQERLAPLTARPGEWARVLVGSRSLASFYANAIKHGTRHIHVPPGRWEAITRLLSEGADQGKVAVYARYLGPAELGK